MSRGVVPIQSVQRAAQFLSLFSAGEPELSLAEITERLGMSRPTVHRYGMSLRSTGLVRYDAARGTYSLGPRIIELGRVALANLSILKIAQPLLEELSAQTNETVVMALWDGEAPVVVQVADRTDRFVSVAVRAGTRLPVLSSAQGQINLAFSPAARAVHERDPGFAELAGELELVRDRGAAISDGVIPGITVVAAPVFDEDDLAGTVALICHQASGVARFDAPAVVTLREHAQAISERLGRTH